MSLGGATSAGGSTTGGKGGVTSAGAGGAAGSVLAAGTAGSEPQTGGSTSGGTGGSLTGGVGATGGSLTGGTGGSVAAGTGGVTSGGSGGTGNGGQSGSGQGGSFGQGGSGGGAGKGGSSGQAGNGGTGGSGTAGSGQAGGGGLVNGTCASTTTATCPSSLACPSGMECGCYKVSGIAANKQALLAAGGNAEMMASAMMETERLDANYTLGDGKTNDSFNAGVCKQNWGMIRQCHPAYQGMSQSQYQTAAALNSDRALDATVFKECRAMFGDRWWGGHRNGSSGLQNPNTADIQRFKAAYDWTLAQIGTTHQCDDLRFWVSVPAIDVIFPED